MIVSVEQTHLFTPGKNKKKKKISINLNFTGHPSRTERLVIIHGQIRVPMLILKTEVGVKLKTKSEKKGEGGILCTNDKRQWI